MKIRIICPQKFATQTGYIGDGLHAENNEAHLIFGGFKFNTKYNANSGVPIYNSVNCKYKFKAYNMELHQYGAKTDNLTLSPLSLLKWNQPLGHINFQLIIQFTHLGLIPSI